MPEGNRAREKWLRNSLNCKKGRVGKKEEKMWGKKDMTRKGEIQKMKGSEVGVGLVMDTHEIEGVWAKGIPGFERLGKKRGKGGKSAEG